MSVSRCLSFFSIPIVDILDFVGLKDSNTSSQDALLTVGPSGMLDAFSLERELNTSTVGPEWEQISQDFPTQFGLHTVFNASEYEGSIISISNKSGLIFDVSLSRTENSTGDTLTVTLPGLSSFHIRIPEGANLRDGSFQSLGIRLVHYQLVVVVDCVVVNFVDLVDPILPLPVTGGEVRVFGDQAIVSVDGGGREGGRGEVRVFGDQS